jgi:hypothetical protein
MNAMTSVSTWPSIVLLSALLPLSVGCGSAEEVNLAPVKGTIISDGKPVSNALVEFFPDEGRTSVGSTNAEGVYTLKHGDANGAVVGACRVQITPEVAAGPADSEQGSDVMAPPMSAPPSVVAIPDKVSVAEGENTLDFNITAYMKKGKKVRR